jgi:alkylation response protein AidB-like acyl-CoA dehydrogenase
MTPADRDMIVNSLRALFATHWPMDRAAVDALEALAVRAVWTELQARGFDRITQGFGLEGGVIAAVEAGRAGCPVPIIPAVVADMLNLEFGEGALATALDAEDLTLADGKLSGVAVFVEHCAVAERLIVSLPGGIGIVALAEATVVPTPGLAVPPLANAAFKAAPAQFIATDRVADVAIAERLLLAARALGAAKRAFDLVRDHVQQRSQFGHTLARFQSMQHKLADCHLVLDSAELLIAEAAERHDAGDANWRFSANAAIAYASRLRKVSLETHHAFGAIGYAEEHEAPRHFRRVHADLLRMGGNRTARAALAAEMIEGRGSLPDRSLGDEAEEFRREFRDWLSVHWTETDVVAQRAKPFALRNRNENIERALGAAGYLSIAWPIELGGKGARPLTQLVLMEELERAQVSASGTSASAWLLAPEIIRHGSSWLRQKFLPGIASGEIKFALGYSEPEAGSDLTALRTRAVRDGNHYVVTGQKLWGTGTEHATHIALAVRTDPKAASKAQGISVLLVPTDLPGITIQPSLALYGHTFCTQFFDEVRVPVEYLLGEENKGWTVLTGALAAERILMGGQIAGVARVFEEFCAHIAARPSLAGDALVRDMIGQYAAEFEAARQLALRSVLTLEQGRLPVVEGAITKVISGELTERFCEQALDVLGMAGTLSEDAPGAPVDGQLEQLLRRSIMLVVGGGAAEIQKTIIAQRGLGLPR